MPHYEEYMATAPRAAAAAVMGGGPGPVSPFQIVVRFLGGLTENQKDAFKRAADRWARVIVGDLPQVTVDGEQIDDVLILAEGVNIDGPGKILGQAGPTHLRPKSTASSALLPAKGVMRFDTADLTDMERKNTLVDVITHEMGHVLGVGTIWDDKNLLDGIGDSNPMFLGATAMAEYGRLKGSGPAAVPVENSGGPGTRDSHWRESIFFNELMSGFISGQNNPLSRLTVGSLQDLGYVVDLNAAESYALPNLLVLAEEGLLRPHVAPIDAGVMLPVIPTVLPADSVTP